MRPNKAPLCFGGASRTVGADAQTARASSSLLCNAALADRDAAFMGHTDG
jgi:hypothetical protein